MRHTIIFLAFGMAPLTAVAQRAYEVRNTFLWQQRGAELHEINGRITRVFGRPFGSGQSPRDTAARFCESYAEMFGVLPADLLPGNPHDQRLTQPIMYDVETDTYRYTMVYYRQYCGGIPVYKSEMRLLVANREGHPLVWVNPYLRDVGVYNPAAAGQVLPEQVFQETARAIVPQLSNFTQSRLVVYAGIDHVDAEPRLAVVFTADNLDRPSQAARKRTFVMDAVTAEVLHSENGILNYFPDSISGTVSGVASPDYLAWECTVPLDFVLRPLPYALVEVVGGNSAFADATGAFVIPDLGAPLPATVRANISGKWFTVTTGQGSLLVDEQIVTMPNEVIDFELNEVPAFEYPTAQVNAYIQANEARDRALAANPMFPVIATQEGFGLKVNINGCRIASWRGTFLQFSLQSSSSCFNSAFGDIVHHEYGHHLVASAGNDQKAYGEGMGDVMGLLATDDPVVARGWTGNCNVGIRTAANTCQYEATGCSSCGSEVHACGTVLSGSVWDTRVELVNASFDDYRKIIRNLAVNSMLLHTGSSIDPSIYIDWLILDDDNADLLDGTPHDVEIKQGFANHSMTTGVPDVTGDIYTWTGLGSTTAFDDPCNWTNQVPCGTDYPQNAGDAAFVDGSSTGSVDLVSETIRKLAVSRNLNFFAAAGTPTLQVKAFTLFAPDGDIEVTITTAKIQQPPGP